VLICRYIQHAKDLHLNQKEIYDKISKRIFWFGDMKKGLEYVGEIKNCGLNILVILDDITDINSRYKNEITQLYIKDRHYNVSCIYLVQSTTLLSTHVRTNSDLIFIFRVGSPKEKKFIKTNIADVDVDEIPQYACYIVESSTGKKEILRSDLVEII